MVLAPRSLSSSILKFIFIFFIFTSYAGANERIVLAGGCFWGVEEFFRKLPGVVETGVGYAGGNSKDPTYSLVSQGKTGHTESVEVIFNPKKISLNTLLDKFFKLHDPTTLNEQSNDKGTQYRSAIFFLNETQEKQIKKFMAKVEKSKAWKRPLVTEVKKLDRFYEAEEEHQKYLLRNPKGYDNHYLRNISF